VRKQPWRSPCFKTRLTLLLSLCARVASGAQISPQRASTRTRLVLLCSHDGLLAPERTRNLRADEVTPSGHREGIHVLVLGHCTHSHALAVARGAHIAPLELFQ
jgi:hypothetical protein